MTANSGTAGFPDFASRNAHKQKGPDVASGPFFMTLNTY